MKSGILLAFQILQEVNLIIKMASFIGPFKVIVSIFGLL